MRPLQVVLLSDGRPGHYHLAEGVCAALRRLRPVTVETLRIDRRRQVPTRVLMAAFKAGLLSPSALLQLGYGVAAAALPKADLVISAGGDTLAANVAAAQALGAQNVFCGTLRHAKPEDFALIVSSYARHERLPHHIVCLKPTAMDPHTLGRPAVVPSYGPNSPPHLAALLIGGDSGLFHYMTAEWRALLAFLGAQHAAHGTRWLVSTSRRTPDWVADAIAPNVVASGAVAELLDYRTAGPGTLPQLLSRAEAVLCTEDSSTMISETIAARLPVVGVAPVAHAFKDDEAEYRALMLARGWARFVPLGQLTPERFLGELAQITPLAENHLELLARQLRERLPMLAA